MSPGLMVLLSAFMFCLGAFMVMVRRNAVLALIGIELMLNAANLNFVAFSSLWPDRIAGQTAGLFVMALAAAEAAIGLALILRVFRKFRSIELNEIDSIKD